MYVRYFAEDQGRLNDVIEFVEHFESWDPSGLRIVDLESGSHVCFQGS